MAAFHSGFRQRVWRIVVFGLPCILPWASTRAAIAAKERAGIEGVAEKLRALPARV